MLFWPKVAANPWEVEEITTVEVDALVQTTVTDGVVVVVATTATYSKITTIEKLHQDEQQTRRPVWTWLQFSATDLLQIK